MSLPMCSRVKVCVPDNGPLGSAFPLHSRFTMYKMLQSEEEESEEEEED